MLMNNVMHVNVLCYINMLHVNMLTVYCIPKGWSDQEIIIFLMYPFFSSYSVVQDEMEQKLKKKKKDLSHDFSKICTW